VGLTLDSRWAWASGAFLLALAVWAVGFALSLKIPGPRSDTWDYIQLGESLAAGEGFQSRFTYPILLSIDS